MDTIMERLELPAGAEVFGAFGVRGEYEVVCRGRPERVRGMSQKDAPGGWYRPVKWSEKIKNTFVNTGLNYLLDNGFGGTEYLGLKGSGTPSASDTMSSHASWSEVTAYSESVRQTYSHASASSQQVTNSASKATFSINATTTVYGIFCTTSSTKSGTAGTLISATDFASSKAADNGDTLEVTYTVTAANG